MDIPRRNWLKLAAALAFGGRMPPGHAADSPKLLERSIPKTGEKIAAVGLGTWQVFDVAGDAAETAQAKETLKTFVGLGGRVLAFYSIPPQVDEPGPQPGPPDWAPLFAEAHLDPARLRPTASTWTQSCRIEVGLREEGRPVGRAGL